jgi:hypothetical protein
MELPELAAFLKTKGFFPNALSRTGTALVITQF